MKFLTASLCFFAFIVITYFTLDFRRKKALKAQGGEPVIYGKAGASLATSKMRISASNRSKGLVGEEGVGARLEELAVKYGFTVIHDLSIPGSKANIDHIFISGKAIFVIDAKNYKGKIEIKPNKSGVKVLRVGGQDRTILAQKLSSYSLHIQTALESVGMEAKVVPLLAFYKATFDNDSSLMINDVLINALGIENELKRFSISKSPDIDIPKVAALILEKFPPRA